jgi:hypothetical protein
MKPTKIVQKGQGDKKGNQTAEFDQGTLYMCVEISQ